MPNLKIEYNGLVLHDGDVDELSWTDVPGAVTVVGKLAKPVTGQGIGGLLGALARKETAGRRPADPEPEVQL